MGKFSSRQVIARRYSSDISLTGPARLLIHTEIKFCIGIRDEVRSQQRAPAFQPGKRAGSPPYEQAINYNSTKITTFEKKLQFIDTNCCKSLRKI